MESVKRMRILWFTNTPSLAAARLNVATVGEGWVQSLEERLTCFEHIELAIAFSHGKDRIDKFTKDQTTYYAMPYKGSRIKTFVNRHLGALKDEELMASCLEIIDDFRPDLINIFGTEKGYGLISEKTDIPVVIHLQGVLTVLEKKFFSAGVSKWTLLRHSSLKSLVKATTLMHNYNYFRQGALREQRIFRQCRYFMGRTDWDKRISSVLAPNAGYFTSHEILRKEFYRDTWKKEPRETKVFVSTIQANIFKGLETVLECAMLLKKLNKFNFTWIIAGTVEDEKIVEIFESKAGGKFKDFNVILRGRLKAEELLKCELEADLFIHPSHIDNSPNSVCEAMLIGMPVIATYSGGTGSLLTDKKEGILIQDGDPYSLAGAILELVKDPEQAERLGQNARKRALERHDPAKIAGNLVDIYSEIISAAG